MTLAMYLDFDDDVSAAHLILNKMFWKELIGYFHLIPHGLRGKKMGGGTHRQQGNLISLKIKKYAQADDQTQANT
jgi:hypothetical protein